jgi:hypothetical protein
MRHIVQAPPRAIVAPPTVRQSRRNPPKVALAQTPRFYAMLHVRMLIGLRLDRIRKLFCPRFASQAARRGMLHRHPRQGRPQLMHFEKRGARLRPYPMLAGTATGRDPARLSPAAPRPEPLSRLRPPSARV